MQPLKVLAAALLLCNASYAAFTGFLGREGMDVCPYAGMRSNPVVSGLRHEIFNNTKTGYYFYPDWGKDYSSDVCLATMENSINITVTGQALVKDPDTLLCSPCTDCKCVLWTPGPDGNYQQQCIGDFSHLISPVDGKFTLVLPRPGDEKKAGWGPDGIPHVHFDCVSESTGAKLWNKYYFDYMSFEDFCTYPGSPSSMTRSAPDDSNFISSMDGSKHEFAFILEVGWSNKHDPCWMYNEGNPCDAFVEEYVLCPTCRSCDYNPRDDAANFVSPTNATNTTYPPPPSGANVTTSAPAVPTNASADGSAADNPAGPPPPPPSTEVETSSLQASSSGSNVTTSASRAPSSTFPLVVLCAVLAWLSAA